MTAPTALMPVLKVNDLGQTIDFYQRLFGFTARRLGSEAATENCLLSWGAVEILCSTGAHLGGAPCFTGTLYFRLDGVDELYERVKDQAEIVWPLEDMDYGTREFGARDPNGYVLAFAQGR